MGQILILVASDDNKPLTLNHLHRVASLLESDAASWNWLDEAKAAELFFDLPKESWSRALVQEAMDEDCIDCFVIDEDKRRKKRMLISDMDNTMVVGETLDDLAASCNLKEEIAAITARAMAGEIDFQAALRKRVMMLRGLSADALGETAREIEYMPGAETLVRVMRENGAFCVLVSGGFTCFTAPVADQLGFHAHHGNVLELRDGLLSGAVEDPILDHHTKLSLLQHYCELNSIPEMDCLAVGDGANDLAMISAAGLGVGFHPKEYLKKRAQNSIVFGDLTALLYIQGYHGFSAG